MYIYILILFIILFITFCLISKKELLKSLLYTAYFILTLWINIPCFVNISDINEISNNLLMIPFRLNQDLGIFYIIIANVILCTVLYLQALFSNNLTYTYKEVKRKYDCFGDDAIKLYIVGKDLDFLNKKEYKKQTDRIIHLGNRCKLLCEPTNDRKLLDLYKDVYRKGVEIRFYTQNGNITNLKGQIKVDHNGNKKAIFMSRINKKYVLLNIENQFLVESILERYNDIYKNSSVGF